VALGGPLFHRWNNSDALCLYLPILGTTWADVREIAGAQDPQAFRWKSPLRDSSIRVTANRFRVVGHPETIHKRACGKGHCTFPLRPETAGWDNPVCQPCAGALWQCGWKDRLTVG
jgi:hypothetical protein